VRIPGVLAIHLTQVTPTYCGDARSAVRAAHEPRIRHGAHGHGLLNEPEKEHAAVVRPAAVEPERELVQVVVQMRRAGGALMGTEQPPFEQGDDAVHARQVLGGQFRVAAKKRDPMSIPVGFQPVVPVPPVGMHLAAGLDGLVDEGAEWILSLVAPEGTRKSMYTERCASSSVMASIR